MVRLHFDYCAAHSIPIKEKLRQGVVSLEEHNGLWNEVIIAQNHAEKVSTKTTSTENTKLWASFPPPQKTEHLSVPSLRTVYDLSPLLHKEWVLHLITDLISSEISLCASQGLIYSHRVVNWFLLMCSIHPHTVNDVWCVCIRWNYVIVIWAVKHIGVLRRTWSRLNSHVLHEDNDDIVLMNRLCFLVFKVPWTNIIYI